jgi:hemerythrin superfamily protein
MLAARAVSGRGRARRPEDSPVNAVTFLIAQHRSLEGLMDRTLEAASPDERAAALALVGDELVKHLASEEEVFYPAVRASSTVDVLLESLEEHLSLKRFVADLIALDPQAETWEAKFKVLREQAMHHHGEEEEHLFPGVSAAMRAEDLDALGRDLLALQQRLARSGDPRVAVLDQTDEAAPL